MAGGRSISRNLVHSKSGFHSMQGSRMKRLRMACWRLVVTIVEMVRDGSRGFSMPAARKKKQCIDSDHGHSGRVSRWAFGR